MTSSIIKLFFLSVIFVLCLFKAAAQTDTEFWFAAPEVSTGPSLFDRSIYIRISTLQQASSISISQPANSNFLPILLNIGANTTRTIDLTDYIETIENKPANLTLDYGLLITASNPVSAYYEVASNNCNCNPEIFSLKGKNALGTLFYTPFQNIWDNSLLVTYTPTPYSSFDIVATENNTTVTVTPKNDLFGHPAGIKFSINLNKGQTYSATALSQLATKHLGGSEISADKPIAVTIKDDLLYVPVENTSILGIDLIGDQIVPVNVIGNEYIITKGMLFSDEKAFILATQDATAIYIDGNTTPITTINAGNTYTLTISNSNTYIKATKPVYVLHTSGYEYELGAALIPKLECNGSRQVGFTRSNSQKFGLSLVVKKGGEKGFILNGNPNAIASTAFSSVSGTGGEWLSAQIEFNTTDIPVNVARLITNVTSVFQMGIIDGGDGGASYSYSSDFNNPVLNLGSDKNICPGKAITLDAGGNKDTYEWNDGSKNRTLTVTEGGKYWVTATIGNCILRDTIIISENSLNVNLGGDKVICKGQTIILNATSPEATYKWQDGSTNADFEVKTAGIYWVEVTNTCGIARDEITVSELVLPALDLGPDKVLCPGQTLQFDITTPNATYLWQDGSVKPTFRIDSAGLFFVEVTIGGCSLKDSIQVDYNSAPTVNLGNDTILCEGQLLKLTSSFPRASYHWQDGSNKEYFSVSAPGIYWVDVTTPCGTTRDSITISYQELPTLFLGKDTILCEGQSLVLYTADKNASYLWQNFSTDSTFTVVEEGIYWVELQLKNCKIRDSIYVQFQECPEDIYIPNVFTPNGDNKNETFFIKGIKTGTWQVIIYNRWGKPVYQSHQYYNDWNGQDLSSGLYFYYLSNPFNGRKYKGWVHVLR